MSDSSTPSTAAGQLSADLSNDRPAATLSNPEQLIEQLDLAPHPEGGYFREIHRSERAVEPGDGRGQRAGLTVIYYLLLGDQVSRWHRVQSDELWHFVAGDGLDLVVATPDFERLSVDAIGPPPDKCPLRIVVADQWQAARVQGSWCLVSCSVGPGFDFRDFQLLSELPQAAKSLALKHPAWLGLL